MFRRRRLQNDRCVRPLTFLVTVRRSFRRNTVSRRTVSQNTAAMSLYFPVRGRVFYDNPVGWIVSTMMGWFSMYPPFFA